jgi:ribosomal protein S27AE
MNKKLPVLDVIECRTLPTRCPACGVAGAPKSDGQTPITRLSCDRCGWWARYRVRQPEEAI